MQCHTQAIYPIRQSLLDVLKLQGRKGLGFEREGGVLAGFSGLLPSFTVTQDLTAFLWGSSWPFSFNSPTSSHQIEWKLTSQCGNQNMRLTLRTTGNWLFCAFFFFFLLKNHERATWIWHHWLHRRHGQFVINHSLSELIMMALASPKKKQKLDIQIISHSNEPFNQTLLLAFLLSFLLTGIALIMNACRAKPGNTQVDEITVG